MVVHINIWLTSLIFFSYIPPIIYTSTARAVALQQHLLSNVYFCSPSHCQSGKWKWKSFLVRLTILLLKRKPKLHPFSTQTPHIMWCYILIAILYRHGTTILSPLEIFHFYSSSHSDHCPLDVAATVVERPIENNVSNLTNIPCVRNKALKWSDVENKPWQWSLTTWTECWYRLN